MFQTTNVFLTKHGFKTSKKFHENDGAIFFKDLITVTVSSKKLL